jgi:prevent-host-death family protein
MSRKPSRREEVREAAVGYGVTEVSSSDLKNDWHRWLQRVAEGGQTVVVTRYGKPIATLRPVEDDAEPRRIFGALAGFVAAQDDLVSPTGEGWDAEE